MNAYEELRLHGAEIKNEKKTGTLIVGFSSQKLTNAQLRLLKKLDGEFLLAFYGCDFTECDLSILEDSEISNVAVIYSRFTDKEMNDFVKVRKLKKMKIFDTQVTKGALNDILHVNPNLDVKLD
ncbi:MAG: hypothetical protein B0W54_06620 [Cellvibrio sp. 79]|nr:MAG: hypothetical protein B0W54_06620 [Cellvibrio sp. 79]